MMDISSTTRSQLADSLAATPFEPTGPPVLAAYSGDRDVSPGDDTDNGSTDHHDDVADVMNIICDIEATSHLLTFAAIAVAEERGDQIVNPSSVYLTRLRMTGTSKSQSAVKGSMDRLVEKGLVEKIDLEPDSDRDRFDWRLSDLGWKVLSVTGGSEMVRRFARLDPADEDYERQRARLRKAMQNIASLKRTNHLCTLVATAVLDRRGVRPINGPAVISAREECLQHDSPSESAVYSSLGRLEKEDLIEKTDWQPETNRTRMHVRVTESGWSVLQATGTIGMVYDMLRDDD